VFALIIFWSFRKVKHSLRRKNSKSLSQEELSLTYYYCWECGDFSIFFSPRPKNSFEKNNRWVLWMTWKGISKSNNRKNHDTNNEVLTATEIIQLRERFRNLSCERYFISDTLGMWNCQNWLIKKSVRKWVMTARYAKWPKNKKKISERIKKKFDYYLPKWFIF